MGEEFYQNYYEQCIRCSREINECLNGKQIIILESEIETELEAIDYSFAVLLGLIGALITSSKNVEVMLDKIHQIASEKARESDEVYKKIIKFFLGHKGDYIDTVRVDTGAGVKKRFVTRQAKEDGNLYIMESSSTGPHRIFWGHDMLSGKKDNPFYIMQKQIPGLKGVVQTLKHLTADTFSKQGLPVPTSSWWDYSYTDERGIEKVGNRLLDVCNDLYKSSSSKDKISVTGANNEIFNHLFSIHIQDLGVQQIGKLVCDKYLKYRKIENKVVQHQFKTIFYAVLFFINSLIGAIKYGIPYINWPAGLMMIKEVTCMMGISNMETRKLRKITDELLEQTEQLERKINFSSDYLNRI